MQLKISVIILKALRQKHSNILQMLLNATALKCKTSCKKKTQKHKKMARRIRVKFLKKSNRNISLEKLHHVTQYYKHITYKRDISLADT